MIEFILDLLLESPHITIRYPGYLILRYLFLQEVDLDNDPSTSYVLGVLFWLIIIAWLVYRYSSLFK
jgi:hypothetical protein